MGLFGFLKGSKSTSVPPGFENKGQIPVGTPEQILASGAPLPDLNTPQNLGEPSAPEQSITQQPEITQPAPPSQEFQVPDFSEVDLEEVKKGLEEVTKEAQATQPVDVAPAPVPPINVVEEKPVVQEALPEEPPAEIVPEQAPPVENVQESVPIVEKPPQIQEETPAVVDQAPTPPSETTWHEEPIVEPVVNEEVPYEEPVVEIPVEEEIINEDDHIVVKREFATDIFVEKEQYQETLLMMATIDKDMRTATNHLSRAVDNETIVTAKIVDWKDTLGVIQEKLLKIDEMIFEKGEIHD